MKIKRFRDIAGFLFRP